MFSIDGIIYRICTWIYNLVFLNFLFLISALPIVTIPPALAALFGVSRKLVYKEDPRIFNLYWKLFAENFKQSLLSGLVFGLIGLFIIEDFHLLSQLNPKIHLILLPLLSVVGLVYLLTVLYLFPLMVHSYFTAKQLWIHAFKFGIYKVHLSLLNLIVIGGLLLISLRYTFLLVFFFSSLLAYTTYWFADIKFKRVWKAASPEDSVESDD